MRKIKYLTAGESHGERLTGILEGMPAGLEISEDEIAADLSRRQLGHGRGGRMKIEQDRARILSGVRFGKTLGSPIALSIENRDWKNWREKMSIDASDSGADPVVVPRPGHADYAGAIKYGHEDLRNVLERASARETAIRVALAAVTRKFLSELGIAVVSHVVQIGDARNDWSAARLSEAGGQKFPLDEISDRADKSSVRCLDAAVGEKMVDAIDQARGAKDTVGGIFEVVALGVPIGLGSYAHWDRKLDGQIAASMMSIPAMKGVEIGLGFDSAGMRGSNVHDPIHFNNETGECFRPGNHAGGLEGGVTNGMPLVARVAMKPIATLMNPLASVNLKTKQPTRAHIERSDVCAAPAASIIGEAILCLILADALLDKFGGDSMVEIQERLDAWRGRGA